jgi:hypothetical protein
MTAAVLTVDEYANPLCLVPVEVAVSRIAADWSRAQNNRAARRRRDEAMAVAAPRPSDTRRRSVAGLR